MDVLYQQHFTFTPMIFRGRNFLLSFLLYQSVCCYGLVIQLSVVQMLLGNLPVLTENLFTVHACYLAGVAFAAVVIFSCTPITLGTCWGSLAMISGLCFQYLAGIKAAGRYGNQHVLMALRPIGRRADLRRQF